HDLFWPGNDQNPEILFSIQYDEGSLDPEGDPAGSIQSAYFGPYHGGEGLQQGYPYRTYALIPTSYVYDLFNENGLRWEGSFMNLVYERYYDFYDVANTSDLVVARYFPHSWEVADTAAWRAADPAHRGDTEILPYDLIQTDPVINRWEQPIQYFDNMIP